MKTIVPISLLLLWGFTSLAQWSNRYPKVEGYRHHVYLEGFELPILTSGPMDPAPSPLGGEIAFAARGWIWIMDLETMTATRVTTSPSIDSRPEWSPDGTKLTFVRDTGVDMQLLLLDIASKSETVIVDEDAIDLDPIFSLDGRHIYYSTAINGPFDLWQISIDNGAKDQITSGGSLKRRPLPLPGDDLLYINKAGSYNSIERLDKQSGSSTTLLEDRITSQADMTATRDGSYMAYTWPYDGGYEIRLLDLVTPNTSVLLTRSRSMPLTPAFDSQGQWIYFAEATDEESMALKRISVQGGETEELRVRKWEWGAATGKIKITTRVDGEVQAVRLNVLDASGHPLIPTTGTVRSEGQNGRVFFYSDGEIELEGLPGEITISAVQGFATPEVIVKSTIIAGRPSEVVVDLTRLWDARANGWYAGDNHFHLNYGGTYRLEPEDIVLDMKGEGMDVATPLLANLHNRFLEQDLWGWKYEEGPIIAFGQEVRSHFLGHLELIGINDLFWPWIWGPFYQVYSRDDRINATALRFARAQGGLGGYVHPVPIREPFTKGGESGVPINFVADAVQEEVDLIELACLWTDELGTGDLWHKVLNLGIPLAASGGSDVMNDYYRTMAIGSTRVYVKTDGPLTLESYLAGLKAGRSFISNGPLIQFKVDDKEPGQVVSEGKKKVKWELDVHSARPYSTVEILVNGEVVTSRKGTAERGSRNYKGSLVVPVGGWVTARVYGGETAWPFMDSYPFAETSPVWFGAIGSTDPEAKRAAANDLLRLLVVSKARLQAGYGETPIPKLLEHFDKARVLLETMSEE